MRPTGGRARAGDCGTHTVLEKESYWLVRCTEATAFKAAKLSRRWRGIRDISRGVAAHRMAGCDERSVDAVPGGHWNARSDAFR